MNNKWNKIIYNIGSPFYDWFFNSGVFLQARKKVFQGIPFNENQRILFVGVGTGADLELIKHSEFKMTAIDYSPHMLEKARNKFRNSDIEFMEMDAQELRFGDRSFDYCVASLILSVVPDAKACLSEMVRVLEVGGRIVIFDKFAPVNAKLSLPLRMIRPIISALGTDIGRSFEEIFSSIQGNTIIEVDTPVMFAGMYRKIIIRKIS